MKLHFSCFPYDFPKIGHNLRKHQEQSFLMCPGTILPPNVDDMPALQHFKQSKMFPHFPTRARPCPAPSTVLPSRSKNSCDCPRERKRRTGSRSVGAQPNLLRHAVGKARRERNPVERFIHNANDSSKPLLNRVRKFSSSFSRSSTQEFVLLTGGPPACPASATLPRRFWVRLYR